jgi:LysR family transcriptional activator of nhaA
MAALNYHHLRYFRAVAKDGNLTRTAGHLNVSQSALSIQIKRLEESLGHALFTRQGRQLILTEAGRIALDYADSIFSAGEELLGTLSQAGRARQAIRIGALATLSRNFQLSFLGPLVGRTDIDLILRSGTVAELVRGLEALNLDLILLNQPPPRDALSAFVSHRLSEWRVSLIGAKPPLSGDTTLEQFLSDNPVILPTADSSIRLGFDALAARLSITPQVAAEVDDMAMIRLLTRQGVGMAVIPPIVVRDELESGQLFELTTLPEIVETFYAVTLDRKFPNPLIEPLIAAHQKA